MFRRPLLACFLATFSVLVAESSALHGDTIQARPDILAGHYDPETQTFDSLTFANQVVGADFLYNYGYFGSGQIVANVEGGLVWDGHEVFDRSGLGLGPTVSLTSYITPNPTTAPEAGSLDFHATMVGHVLAGTGYSNGSLTYLGAGMAPLANIWSGAIATTFSSTEIGSFEISTESFVTPYKTFFNGVGNVKPAAINSSWGEDDPAGVSFETATIDGLARQNPTVAFVASAGNAGPGTGTVGGPGSGYNGITVGSLGGRTDAQPYLRPSDFTSSGPIDFYNPQTEETLHGVRAGVTISAPGEDLVLAAYLGATGSLKSRPDITQTPSPTDQYFLNQAGTSFAAPIVSGGITLLKDVAQGNLTNLTTAEDSRVVKAVLMAGATRTTGWNNGQTLQSGVVRTTQALDYTTGAGRLNLEDSSLIYVTGTHDVTGLGGGSIESLGWDFGSLALGGTNTYTFDQSFLANVELTLSLSWFVDRGFDNETNTTSDSMFADLNLHLYLLNGGTPELVAESMSLYNNDEFLRFDLTQAGLYQITVTYDGVLYNLTGSSPLDESYGLAWQTQVVPEPSVNFLLAASGLMLVLIYRRRAGSRA